MEQSAAAAHQENSYHQSKNTGGSAHWDARGRPIREQSLQSMGSCGSIAQLDRLWTLPNKVTMVKCSL